MNPREPWAVPRDAVRGLVLTLTFEQFQALRAARDESATPQMSTGLKRGLFGVVVDDQRRNAWLHDTFEAPTRPGENGHVEVELVALVHADLRRQFTACGWGWVLTDSPLTEAMRVDLADWAGAAGPFAAHVVASSEPVLGRFRTLLHADHTGGVVAPTVDGTNLLAADPKRTGAVVADVTQADVVSEHSALSAGQPVEVLEHWAAHPGVVDAIESRTDGPHYLVRLLDDTGLPRRAPFTAWQTSTWRQPEQRADRMMAMLDISPPGYQRGSTSGAVTFYAGTAELGRMPMDVAVLAALLTGLFTTTDPPGSQPDPTSALRGAVEAIANDLGLPIDRDGSQLWRRGNLACGVFPLTWPDEPIAPAGDTGGAAS